MKSPRKLSYVEVWYKGDVGNPHKSHNLFLVVAGNETVVTIAMGQDARPTLRVDMETKTSDYVCTVLSSDNGDDLEILGINIDLSGDSTPSRLPIP